MEKRERRDGATIILMAVIHTPMQCYFTHLLKILLLTDADKLIGWQMDERPQGG